MGKKLSLPRVPEKWRQKWLSIARKSVFPEGYKLSLAGMFSKYWFPSNINNGFH